MRTSCVTVFYFFTLFGHARTLLRYRLLLFHTFRAREHPLALPFSAFSPCSGTRGPSCVTIFYFFTLFGHARTLLRYRFLLFHPFRAREDPLALPFSAFSPFSGTRGPSCVTVFYFHTLFRHARTLLCYRLPFYSMDLGTQQSKHSNNLSSRIHPILNTIRNSNGIIRTTGK
jgi:hypothetical protein